MTDALNIFIIAGEDSGDQLGARLMEALARQTQNEIRFSGVGGPRMADLGLTSLFPMSDIAVMGIGAVIKRLPLLIRRINETARRVIETPPHILVIIDAPDFTHRVAKKVRKARPDIPIIDYVSPTVWAWRPGRSAKMAAYVDHLLALFPFEPAIHANLGGPPTSYVGHPLIDKPELFKGEPRKPISTAKRPVLALLPGSRSGELDRHLSIFGETLDRLRELGQDFQTVIATVPRHRQRLTVATEGWTERPDIVSTEADKFALFRRAHAALAVSGTVTLELGLAGVPMAVAYVRDPLFRIVTDIVRRLPGQVQVASMVLPNIILDEQVVPEHLDPDVSAFVLAADLVPLLNDTTERAYQVSRLEKIWDIMALPDGLKAADLAAEAVLDMIEGHVPS